MTKKQLAAIKHIEKRAQERKVKPYVRSGNFDVISDGYMAVYYEQFPEELKPTDIQTSALHNKLYQDAVESKVSVRLAPDQYSADALKTAQKHAFLAQTDETTGNELCSWFDPKLLRDAMDVVGPKPVVYLLRDVCKFPSVLAIGRDASAIVLPVHPGADHGI